MLGEMSKTLNKRVFFLFVESNSTDRTVQEVIKFLETNEGALLHTSNSINLSLSDRIDRISHYRNFGKTFLKNINASQFILCDSDVYFDSSIVEPMLSHADTFKSDFHCAFGLAGQIDRENARVLTSGHYYDTSVFLSDSTALSSWPRCLFSGCKSCNGYLPSNSGTIPVYTAFGGFAVVSKRVMHNQKLAWSPKIVNGSPRSEHMGLFSQCYSMYNDFRVNVSIEHRVYWDQSTLDL